MSYELGVLAIDGWTEVSEVVAMVERCQERNHAEGELDPRIAGFYERLRARFPDHPPYQEWECPWMSMPLDVGIDHVFMLLGWDDRSSPALELIGELAAAFGLTLWDPQDGSARRMAPPPSREQVAGWWRDLLDGRCRRDGTFDRVRLWVEDPPVAGCGPA